MALLSGLFNILVGYSWLAGALGTDNTDPHCKFLPAETRDIQDTTYFHMVKAARLPSGTTYRYVVHRPSIEKPWLLFLHGFPSTSFDWRYQFEHFASLGYGIIAPDLLGYGGTDNPPELDRFALKTMVSEIKQLLDCEGVDTAVGIAHDFGSVVLSRVITYLPERLTAVAFLTVGYSAPPLAFNEAGIDLINKATEEAVGYTTFGYWGFMSEDNAASIMDANLDSAFTLLYTDNSDYFQKYFAPIGEYKKWLLAGRIAPWTKYLEEESKSIFKRIYNFHGGFDGPLKTYKSMIRDVNLAHENAIPESAAYIKQPVVLITAARDRIALPEAQVNNTKPFAADINITSVDAGHFLQVEKPQEVNKKLEAFIKSLA
ncbi:alpha beta-hydrolase [Fusarium albosuccineum]|uniref:Alpha beta-hydrolase n=1 Tax=Fusarium albosuccineum TaxID=1237068 RepID=A0A8H4LLC6_9HYPO|nr:alpha beta-hydrolase [Fusarium albosuccineum]